MTIDVFTNNTSAQNATADNLHSGTEDLYMMEASPSTNRSGRAYNSISRAASARRDSVLKFTGLSNLPSGATITSAFIFCSVITPPATSRDIEINALLQAFVEDEATWNERSSGNSWSSGGGNDDGVDIDSSYTDTTASGTSVAWISWDVTSWAQDVAATVISNHGTHFRHDTSPTEYMALSGSLDTDGLRPELVVTYTLAAYSVDDVNSSETVIDGETGVSFTTSGFAGEITSFNVKLGTDSTAASNISSSGGAGTVDMPDIAGFTSPTAGAPFSSSILFELSDGADTNSLAGTFDPKAGWDVVTVASASVLKGTLFEDFTGDAVLDGCLIYFSTANNTSFTPSGVWTSDAASDFTILFWDIATGLWTPLTISVSTTTDTTPESFSFTDLTDQPLGNGVDYVVSSSIQVLGINTASPISISSSDGVEYSINGGAYTANAGSVTVGDNVTLRVLIPTANSTTVSGILNIGGVTDTWSVTSLADVIPDAFDFTDQIDVAVSDTITSNTIVVAGIDAAADISIVGAGATFKIDAGAYSSSPTTVTAGQSVTLRQVASASTNTGTLATLSIGGTDDDWNVTTIADTTPNAFSFADQTDVDEGIVISSDVVTITGLDDGVDVDVDFTPSGPINYSWRINGGAWGFGSTIQNGQTLQLQVTSATFADTSVDVDVDIGSITDLWTVTTAAEPADTTPTQFDFATQSNIALSTQVFSNIITVADITSTAAISLSTNSNMEYKINAGAYRTAPSTVENDDTVQMRVTSSGSNSTSVTGTLTIDIINDVWSVSTLAAGNAARGLLTPSIDSLLDPTAAPNIKGSR